MTRSLLIARSNGKVVNGRFDEANHRDRDVSTRFDRLLEWTERKGRFRELRLTKLHFSKTQIVRALHEREFRRQYSRLPASLRTMLEQSATADAAQSDAFALLRYQLDVRKTDPLVYLTDVANSLSAIVGSSDDQDQLLLLHTLIMLAWNHIRPLVLPSDFSRGGRLDDGERERMATDGIDEVFSAFLQRLIEHPTPGRLLSLTQVARRDLNP